MSNFVLLWALLILSALMYEMFFRNHYGTAMAVSFFPPLIASVLMEDPLWQLVSLTGGLCTGFLGVRPYIVRKEKKERKEIASLIGEKTVLLCETNEKGGSVVSLHGRTWSVRCDSYLPVYSRVKVTGVCGREILSVMSLPTDHI